MLLDEYYYNFIFLATSTTSGTNVVPASSILTVDQDTLSTMQAEMIAVQVLSQSGDVHLFQKQSGGTAQIVPVTTISSGELQALTQVSNRFFDLDMRVKKSLIQTLTYQLLCKSCSRFMKLGKTLIQALACQSSSTLVLVRLRHES